MHGLPISSYLLSIWVLVSLVLYVVKPISLILAEVDNNNLKWSLILFDSAVKELLLKHCLRVK